MASADAGAAVRIDQSDLRREVRTTWLRLLVILQFAIPALLLLQRWATGYVTRYGWGWQMFSFG